MTSAADFVVLGLADAPGSIVPLIKRNFLTYTLSVSSIIVHILPSAKRLQAGRFRAMDSPEPSA